MTSLPANPLLSWSADSSSRWNATTTDGDFAGTVERSGRYTLLDRALEWIGYYDTLGAAQRALEDAVRSSVRRQHLRDRREVVLLSSACGTGIIALSAVVWVVIQGL